MGSHSKDPIVVENTFETAMFKGEVTAVDHQEFVLNGHVKARQALSCLLLPHQGDTVLYWLDGDSAWILNVLASNHSNGRELSLPQQQDLRINGNNLVLNAANKLTINALNELNFNVALGKINQCAKSMYQMVQQSFVQLTKHYINKSEYLDLQAEKLLKSHATQQLITAEKDIKMDADRINMG